MNAKAQVFITTSLLLVSWISFSQRAIPPLANKRVHDEAVALVDFLEEAEVLVVEEAAAAGELKFKLEVNG